MSRRNRIQLHESGVPEIDAMEYPEFTTTADFVRRILPSIEKLAARGYELSEIRDIVEKESKISLPLKTFKSTVSRLRREAREQANQRVPQRAAPPVPVPAASVSTAAPATGIRETLRTQLRPEQQATGHQPSRSFVDRDDL